MRDALLIAAFVHAALFGAFAAIDIGERLRINLRVPPRPPTLVTVEPAPMAVEFVVDMPSPGVGIASQPARLGGVSKRGVAVAASESSSGIERPGSTDAGPASPYMKMRGPDLGLSAESAERIVSATPQELSGEAKRSGKLQNAPNGEAVIYDRVTTMTVERNGKARFRDKPDIDLKLKLPIPRIDIEGMRQDLGATLTEWFKDPEAGKRFGRTQDLPNHIAAVPGACDSWGSVWCDDPLAPKTERYAREQKKTGGSLLGGTADISAYLHRKYVGDPYASRKLKLLDDTRDERVERGTAFRTQQLVRSAELIERNIARAVQLSARERRVALFELWDECTEGEGAEGQAGQRARAQVIGWIREHLPKGSVDAFTDEEIAEFRARQSSRQLFEPY